MRSDDDTCKPASNHRAPYTDCGGGDRLLSAGLVGMREIQTKQSIFPFGDLLRSTMKYTLI